jgi:deoxyhypusine synthase
MTIYEHTTKEKIQKAHETDFVVPTISLDDWTKVKGYNFSTNFDINKFFQSLFTTGFQATKLAMAINVLREMKKNNATIFLGYTSNMISCGTREIIAWLCKEKLIDVIVTTAGGVEEDIIKCLKPFVIGSYDTPGRFLREKGINRTGNLFIPNDRYLYFERFMNKFLDRIYEEYQAQGKIISTQEFCWEIGKEINNEDSVNYWCWKNKIPVFCPALTDGSLGDLIYFFKQRKKDFKIDIIFP